MTFNPKTLKFVKNGSSAADNDVVGNIDFVSENDAGSPETITYSKILCKTV